MSERHRNGRTVAARRLALGIGLLALTAIPARRDRPTPAETRAFDGVNGLPDALHAPVWPVMQCGSLAAVPVAALTLRVAGHDAAAARVAIGGVAAWALAKGMKRVVGRGRPDGLVDAIQVRGRPQTGRGFPSGHAAVATVLALGAASVVPGFRPVLGGAVATVSLSRVYVGAHLPLDVIGGAALGLAVQAGIAIVAPEQPA
ncbi:MAG: phosphatase PAP2 family protein [Acidimicrobiia bacterium]